MQDNAPNAEKKIGVFLSGWEEGFDMAGWARGEGYATTEFTDLAGVEGVVLRSWDVVLVPLSTWVTSGQQLRAMRAEGSAIEPKPAVVVYCPDRADPSEASPVGPEHDVSYVLYPKSRKHLAFQLRAVLNRRQVVADLRYRLKEREDVLRSISEVFFSVDHEFRYTFFNEKAEKVGGKSEADLLGMNMWEAFPALKGTEFHRQLDQVASSRQILVAEYKGPITGGWFDMRIYPSAGGISVLFVDITARKQAEENLRKAQEQLTRVNENLESAVAERTVQLHEANQRLEELLYSIAHDLRSPLRSMQGFAQALVDDYTEVLDDRAREYGRRMTAAATFMDRMLRDLLELSRINKSGFEPEPISVAAAWRSAVAQHEEAMEKTGARVEMPGELGQVAANPTLLVQILANLLGNALKFSRAATTPEVKIWSEPVDDRNRAVYIEDNGIGVDERYYDKIFRVFERLNGAEYEGTGIGLAIARKAAERMHGRLDLTSQVGVGTRFRLVLPADREA
jgi:PAS domain S-box-containing protein